MHCRYWAHRKTVLSSWLYSSDLDLRLVDSYWDRLAAWGSKYEGDIVDAGEVNEGIVLVDSVGTGDIIGVSLEIALVVVVWVGGQVPVFMRTKARTNMVIAKRAPMIVHRMSVFLRSFSVWIGGYLRRGCRGSRWFSNQTFLQTIIIKNVQTD